MEISTLRKKDYEGLSESQKEIPLYVHFLNKDNPGGGGGGAETSGIIFLYVKCRYFFLNKISKTYEFY